MSRGGVGEMAKVRDHIEIVEAAYALEGSHEEWQRRLTERLRESWGDGVVSFAYEAVSTSGLAVFASRALEVEASMNRAVSAAMRRIGVTRRGTRRGLVELLRPAVVPRSPTGLAVLLVRPAALARLDGSRGAGGEGIEAARRGVCFALAARAMGGAEERAWRQLVSQLSNAYRLRRALAGASSTEVRDALRRAARLALRVGRPSEAESRSIRRGLVDGRWSLVDRFDAGGRHFVVAHKSADGVLDLRALTEREIEVARYLALDLSDLQIGRVLRAGEPVVADHVAAIGRKLAVTSRAELVRLLGAFRGCFQAG